MKSVLIFCMTSALACLPLIANADMYKCKTAKGVEYSDRPCGNAVRLDGAKSPDLAAETAEKRRLAIDKAERDVKLIMEERRATDAREAAIKREFEETSRKFREEYEARWAAYAKADPRNATAVRQHFNKTGFPFIGMPEAALEAAYGSLLVPVSSLTTAGGVSRQWSIGSGNTHSGYVYTNNGIVTAVQR